MGQLDLMAAAGEKLNEFTIIYRPIYGSWPNGFVSENGKFVIRPVNIWFNFSYD